MKKLEAIIRSSKFEDVKQGLQEVGINFFSFYETKGFGHQKSKNISYRGSVYDQGFIGRIKLEIFMSEDFVDKAKKAIIDAAHTGEKGDGLIIITDVGEIINIRTGHTNGKSINL